MVGWHGPLVAPEEVGPFPVHRGPGQGGQEGLGHGAAGQGQREPAPLCQSKGGLLLKSPAMPCRESQRFVNQHLSGHRPQASIGTGGGSLA